MYANLFGVNFGLSVEMFLDLFSTTYCMILYVFEKTIKKTKNCLWICREVPTQNVALIGTTVSQKTRYRTDGRTINGRMIDAAP